MKKKGTILSKLKAKKKEGAGPAAHPEKKPGAEVHPQADHAARSGRPAQAGRPEGAGRGPGRPENPAREGNAPHPGRKTRRKKSRKQNEFLARITAALVKNRGVILARVAAPLVVAAILIYLVFSAWYGLRDPYTFVMTYADTMADSVLADGWVVRDEVPVVGSPGVVQIQRDQGEKVGKGQPIAVIYKDEQYIQRQEELAKVKMDLSALQYATYDGSPTGAALEEQMLMAMTDLRTASSSGNFTHLADRTTNYRKLVLRREFLVSRQALEEMTVKSEELKETYAALQTAQSGIATITAPVAGTFYSQVDGYETLLDAKDLDALSPRSWHEIANLTPKLGENDLGKLVEGGAWYYSALLPGECAKYVTAGRTAEIKFETLPVPVKMTVDSVGEVQDDQVVATFRSNKDSGLIRAMRRENSEVVFRSEEGVRVPKEALRVDEDGDTGVYVLSGHKARFRPVEILAEDETNYLVEPNPIDATDDRVLRAGDEVVLASDDLYDGKVVR